MKGALATGCRGLSKADREEAVQEALGQRALQSSPSCQPPRHHPGFALEERFVVLEPLNFDVQQVPGLLPCPAGLLLPLQVLESSSVCLQVVPRKRQSPTPCLATSEFQREDVSWTCRVSIRSLADEAGSVRVVAMKAAVLLPYEPSKHLDKKNVAGM